MTFGNWISEQQLSYYHIITLSQVYWNAFAEQYFLSCYCAISMGPSCLHLLKEN